MRNAFTLIELLVVITIIVVLLALLTPALDRAIYQAQLAVCATNQKGVANFALVYAAAHRRAYPQRKGVSTNNGQSHQLTEGWDGPAADDRYVAMQYLALDTFLDPLCDQVDIDPSETGSRPNQSNAGATNTPFPYVYSGYYMFYGYYWTYPTTQAGMKKLGDRIAFDTGGQGNVWGEETSNRFDVLATDQNGLSLSLGAFVSSHPDSNGLLPLQTYNYEYDRNQVTAFGLNDGFYYVLSRWIIANTSQRRGEIDMNVAHTDGGVARLNAVKWDEGSGGPGDPSRVVPAPLARNGRNQIDYWLNVNK